MLKKISLALALCACAAAALAQEKKITTADFAGTWNIEVMSHQIALVIEPAADNKVTATMMMMGRDTLLKGELVEKTLTLVGVKTEATGTMPPEHGTPGHDHEVPVAAAGAPGRHLDDLKRGSTVTNPPVGFQISLDEKSSGFRVQQFEIVPLCDRGKVDPLHATSLVRTVRNSIFLS